MVGVMIRCVVLQLLQPSTASDHRFHSRSDGLDTSSNHTHFYRSKAPRMQLVSPNWMFDDQIHHSALTFGKHVALELMLHLQFDLTQRGARCCTLQDRSHASVRAAPGPKRREEAMELDNTPDQTEVPLRNGERTPLPPTLAASFSLSPANGKVATNPVGSECEKKWKG